MLKVPIAYDLSNIATAEMTRGHYSEADKLYRQAAGILDGWYGADNPETVQVKTFVALAAMQSGKGPEAEELLKNVLQMQERVYGTDIHPSIAFTYDTLGKLADKRGDLQDAELDFGHSAEINNKLFGERDYKTAICVNNLGGMLVKEGQHARAEKILRPAVTALTAQPRPGNKSLGIAQLNLGEALLGQKRYGEAAAPLAAAYSIFGDQPGTYIGKLQDARRDLVEVYGALKQPEKEAKFRAELARQK
jgi:tetratricopeptide (TPR) repeat protein